MLGGWDGEILSSVEYLDEESRSWHVTCDIPSKVEEHTAVSYKHFMYMYLEDVIPSQLSCWIV